MTVSVADVMPVVLYRLDRLDVMQERLDGLSKDSRETQLNVLQQVDYFTLHSHRAYPMLCYCSPSVSRPFVYS